MIILKQATPSMVVATNAFLPESHLIKGVAQDCLGLPERAVLVDTSCKQFIHNVL